MKVDVITEGDDELTCHCQESHQYLAQCESVHGVVRQSAVQYQSGGVTPCLFFSLWHHWGVSHLSLTTVSLKLQNFLINCNPQYYCVVRVAAEARDWCSPVRGSWRPGLIQTSSLFGHIALCFRGQQIQYISFLMKKFSTVYIYWFIFSNNDFHKFVLQQLNLTRQLITLGLLRLLRISYGGVNDLNGRLRASSI